MKTPGVHGFFTREGYSPLTPPHAMSSNDPRQHAPAAQRNAPFILDVLRRVLPERGRALEIASGTGQHAVAFAAGLPGWTWQPSDVADASLRSIAAWCASAGLPNVLAPIRLDVLDGVWPDPGTFDAVFCANMLHIAPWDTCPALMRGAAFCLSAGGTLAIYGPFFGHGTPVAPSNIAFDADLRAHDSRWGVSRLEDVAAVAARPGFVLREVVPMPANNLMLVFGRR